MNLIPINESSSRQGTIKNLRFVDIKDILGPDNYTKYDDPRKVKASWSYQDEGTGRKVFVWCYKVDNLADCTEWSCGGDNSLLVQLFGDNYTESMY